MLTKDIIEYLNNDDSVNARKLTHVALNAKLTELLADKYDEIAPSLFGEAKKAPKTDKEDDGDGMDPVGHGDSDIDNDGDSDSSDKYLKNRRKTIKKAINKEEMDPTDHVKKNEETGMYCVYNKDGKKVKEFKEKSDADKYATDNHDSLMKENVSSKSAGRKRGGDHSYGVPTQTFKTAKPDEKSRIKQKHYQDKERETRDNEAKRKRDEREREVKRRERGISS